MWLAFSSGDGKTALVGEREIETVQGDGEQHRHCAIDEGVSVLINDLI
jgi:hypothetical protein